MKSIIKNEKGITLIALVITIIILLILAGVSISAAIGDNGIITRAKTAVDKYKEKEQEELAFLQNVTEYMNQTIPSGGTNTGNNGDDSEGETTPDEDKIGDLKNSSDEVIGKIVSDGEDGEIPVPTGFYYVGGTEESGAVISDSANDEKKYKGETNVGNDLDGNQFVWIPCSTTGESGVVAYAQDKQYNDGTQSDKQKEYITYTDWVDTATEENSTNVNYASVTRYGGFFVARYEAGIPSDATFFADSEGDTYYTSSLKNVNNIKPASKANYPVWNLITQENAKKVSSLMYESSSIVSSKLIDSYAWDTAVNWMVNSEVNILDSRAYGNYMDAGFTIENILHAQHLQETSADHVKWYADNIYKYGTITLGGYSISDPTEFLTRTENLADYNSDNQYTMYYEISTGSTEVTKKNNIYDMAGNMSEWTTEEGNHKDSDGTTATDTYAVRRGGSYNLGGSKYPIVHRNGENSATALKSDNVGFRVVLYIK